tara:strand:+ start:5623 stop:5922 length:300 start_codon:yes stop_codon:yes gene_type:complete
MQNDIKIENEDFWFEPLDNFQSYGKIVVVEISEEDLLNENVLGLKEKGSVSYGNWKELENFLEIKEVKSHKLYFENEILEDEWIVFLYTNSSYVTCIAG